MLSIFTPQDISCASHLTKLTWGDEMALTNDDLKDVLSVDKPRGDWVGCILVKDNMFYYGNYDNRITGINLQRLLKVLGGN